MTTEEPPNIRIDTRDAYLKGLGEFIDEYSETESALADILERMSRVRTEVALALFSGVRVDAATKYITRLQEALKAPKADKENFKEVFTHLGIINQIRNDILHYGTNYHGPGPDYSVTNKRVALTKDRLREIPMSAQVLRRLTIDLETINAKLRLFYARGLPSEAMAHETWGTRARRAWRYKPSPPPSRGKRPRSKLPKQPRQPRSSPQ